jgi:hypothetical protein
MNERAYQRELIKRIKARFPGCVVMKNDPQLRQGVPDLLILYGGTWAMLEVKMDADSPMQSNQEFYVEKFANMSYAAFINPGNEEQILDDLQQTFRSAGQTRIP